jgi:hypothetical protein
MLFGVDVPRVGTPPIGVILRDAKGLQQLLQPHEDVILAPSEHIREHLATMMINRVPQPTRVRFAAHVTPHFVKL